MKKFIIGIFLFLLLASMPAYALLSPAGGGLLTPSALCEKAANVWAFCNTSDALGNASNKIANGNFTSLTIGSLTVSSSVPGDLLVSATSTSAFIVEQGGGADIFTVDTQTPTITVNSPITTNNTFTSSRTTDLGWSVVNATNQACNTTCTSACVVGIDNITTAFLACTDATADSCLCAGSS